MRSCFSSDVLVLSLVTDVISSSGSGSGSMLLFAVINVKAAADDEGSAQPCPDIGPFGEDQPAEQGGPDQRDIGEGGDDRGRCPPESLDEKQMPHTAQQARTRHEQPVHGG